MNSILIAVLFFILSYAFDKLFKAPKDEKEPQNDILQEVSEQKKSKKPNYTQKTKKTQRKIVDREEEIYSNSNIIDREKIVNDIIFAEILSKPKSKK